MRVIYETTDDCKKCPHNTGKVCLKLGKYLFDICFEEDCPLPTLDDVEKFTRYVTKDKKLECHGNCKNWERWHYNKALNTDVGMCNGLNSMLACLATDKACEEYDEI